MWFNKKQTASKETLEQETKDLSSKGSVQAIKDWWNTKSKKEKAIIIGILAAAISSPFIIAYAKALTVTSFVPDATGGFWIITENAALWHKALVASALIATVGVSTSIISARFNGDSVQQIIDKNVK